MANANDDKVEVKMDYRAIFVAHFTLALAAIGALKFAVQNGQEDLLIGEWDKVERGRIEFALKRMHEELEKLGRKVAYGGQNALNWTCTVGPIQVYEAAHGFYIALQDKYHYLIANGYRPTIMVLSDGVDAFTFENGDPMQVGTIEHYEALRRFVESDWQDLTAAYFGANVLDAYLAQQEVTDGEVAAQVAG